jgi:hypothetical protein
MRALAIASLLAVTSIAGASVAPGQAPSAAAQAAPTEASSQRARAPRARTRITVSPIRRFHRECDFRLVQEVRASGTYVVPRQRCWWVPYPPPP